MIQSRRGFLAALLAAPIIVRPGILMPIRPLDTELLTATEINEAIRRYIVTSATTATKWAEEYHRVMLFGAEQWEIGHHGFQVGDIIEISP